MIILCIKLNYLIAIHPKKHVHAYFNLCKYFNILNFKMCVYVCVYNFDDTKTFDIGNQNKNYKMKKLLSNFIKIKKILHVCV